MAKERQALVEAHERHDHVRGRFLDGGPLPALRLADPAVDALRYRLAHRGQVRLPPVAGQCDFGPIEDARAGEQPAQPHERRIGRIVGKRVPDLAIGRGG